MGVQIVAILRGWLERWQRGQTKDRPILCLNLVRHSNAIKRLCQTRNPKAVQDQLRNKTAWMTLRYLKTLGDQEFLKIQRGRTSGGKSPFEYGVSKLV